MSATSEIVLDKFGKILLKQIVHVVITTQGHLVTEGQADREKGKLLYSNCHNYVKNSRFLIDYSGEIESRQDFFQENGYMDLAVATSAAAVIRAKLLEEEFPLDFDLSVSDDQGDKIWKTFQEIKTYCRNECAPKYKEYQRRAKSGNYTDSETLKEIIKESICKQIADNKTKVNFTMTICLLGTVNKFYVLLTGIKQISLWSEESTWEFSAPSVSRSELFMEETVWIIKRRTLQETLWRMG